MVFASGNDKTGTIHTGLIGGVDPNGEVKAIKVLQSGTLSGLMPQGFNTSYLGTAVSGNLKNTSGNIHAIICCNSDSSTAWFQIFDKGSAPVSGDIPSFAPLPVYQADAGRSGLLLIGQDILGSGIYLQNGISWGLSSSRLTFTAASTPNNFIVAMRWT